MRDELFTVKDLASYLRVHTSSVYRLLKSGEIPCFKIGSNYRFDRRRIDEWTAARTINPYGPKRS